MVVLHKTDTNLDEVVNDVNNLVNCIHFHGPFFPSCFVFLCVCAFFFFLIFFFSFS